LRRDNPLLTTRGFKNPEPLRVVFTKSLDLPTNSNLWDCNKAKTLVIYDSSTANENYLTRIPECVEVEKVSSDNPELISKILAKRGCNKVLWECGPRLATAAIQSNCIQEIITFIAPKILGGENSMNPFGDFEFREMHETIKLSDSQFSLIEMIYVLRAHSTINFYTNFNGSKYRTVLTQKKQYRYGNSSFSL